MMNIYDFDKTIYDGDSSIDFFKFCIIKNKKCLLIMPMFIIEVILYKLRIIKKEKLKSTFFSFLKYFNEIDEILEEFWNINIKKIKKFYLHQRKGSDLIVSASPEFLLKPISRKLNFNLIATDIDLKTGLLKGKNCYGIEKLKRLEEHGINECNEFYSDSKSDLPLRKIAKKGYIVKGKKIDNWEI